MADESETGGERTEQATQRRRDEARREGRVARSVELTSAAVLLSSMIALTFFGPRVLVQLESILREGIGAAARPISTVGELQGLFQHLVISTALVVLPLSLTLSAVGVAANLAQVGFLFTTKTLSPRWSILDPIQGLKRMFSLRGGVELVKAIAKISIVGAIAWATVIKDMPSFLPLAGAGGAVLLTQLGAATVRLGLRVALAFLILAALDYGYQRWDYERSLRMTKKEIEEEQKETEGDPRVKARIRMLQRSAARRRMMADVKTADVVVTNPIHVAIALKYDRATMSAPTVVARGLRKLAERIKEEAKANGIPIVEDPPLARLLYKTAPLGRAIPSNLYRAVAQVLAYVWRLKRGVRASYTSGLGA
ncbi:MAG: flagellar biosynthesis protein FlhB [Candidatus Eisenbacteria bacterium]